MQRGIRQYETHAGFSAFVRSEQSRGELCGRAQRFVMVTGRLRLLAQCSQNGNRILRGPYSTGMRSV
jgi:hypothetical protein